LIFSSNRTGRFQVWMAAPNGSSARQVSDVENAQNPTMTGDGEWIVFVRQDAGKGANGVWKIRPDGSDASLVAAGGFLIPEVSPDGRYVALRGPAGGHLLRIADGTLLDVSLADTDRFRWTVENGRTWLWTIGRGEDGNDIRRYAFDLDGGTLGRPQAVLGEDAAGFVETLGVAPDGSAVTFASLANRRSQLLRIDGLKGLVAR
jgi:hypothetical protein